MNIPKRFKKAIRLLNKYYIENNIEEKKKKCCTIEREFKLLEQQYQKLENPWKDPKIELPEKQGIYLTLTENKELNRTVLLREPLKCVIECKHIIKAWMEIPEPKFKDENNDWKNILIKTLESILQP